MAISSPPYDFLRIYSGHVFDFDVFREIARQLVRVLKNGAVIVWVVGNESINGSESLTPFKQAIFFVEECGLLLHDHMIYEKNTPSFPSGINSTRYSQIFEHVFVFSKGKPKTINLLKDKINRCSGLEKSEIKYWLDKKRRKARKYVVSNYGVRHNIWHYYVGSGISTTDKKAHRHPAIMPDLLALDHIRTWSKEGDVVIDPLCGSGTVLAMAKAAGRNYVGIEIAKEYMGIIEDRLNYEYNYDELVENSFRNYNKITTLSVCLKLHPKKRKIRQFLAQNKI